MVSWELISPYLAPAGLAILVFTFVIRLRGQYRKEAMRQQQRKSDVVHDATYQKTLTNNGGRGLPRQPSRLPKLETPFTGQDTTQNHARREIEIDALGRQIIGQINSKMVAIQTLLLETERLTSRVEIVLERLEQGSDLLAKLTPPQRQEKSQEKTVASEIIGSEIAIQETPLPSPSLELPAMPRPPADAPISIDNLFAEHTPRQSPRTHGLGVQDRSGERQRDASLLLDYGYTPREIAARLNASVGEVESLLRATG